MAEQEITQVEFVCKSCGATNTLDLTPGAAENLELRSLLTKVVDSMTRSKEPSSAERGALLAEIANVLNGAGLVLTETYNPEYLEAKARHERSLAAVKSLAGLNPGERCIMEQLELLTEQVRSMAAQLDVQRTMISDAFGRIRVLEARS